MMSTRILFPRITVNSLVGSVRHNPPNQYSAGYFSYDTVKGNGKKIPSHELSHKIIRRNSDGKIVGGFTTEPKSNFDNTLIDNTELINGKQKMPGENGQFITAFKKEKIIDVPAYATKKPIFIVDKTLQPYLDKREVILDNFYNIKKDYPSELRLHKEDSRFYNEDGTRDYENFP